MVIFSGFKVQLVYADSKVPLKEHVKDGEVYVEAEPDVDYFIAVRRIDMDGPPACNSRLLRSRWQGSWLLLHL